MALRNFSWVIPNLLAGSALPGGHHFDNPDFLRSDLAELASHGVTCLVSLIDMPGDMRESCLQENIEWLPFPIPDFGTPDNTDSFSVCIASIVDRLRRKQAVCVHCFAGVGRTGLVLACITGSYLALTPKQAIAVVRKSRSAIDTDEQKDFVHHFLTSQEHA